MLYIGVSILIMFLGNLMFMQTARSAGLDITVGHLLQMVIITMLAPITLPLLLILEFSQINLDRVVFKKKS